MPDLARLSCKVFDGLMPAEKIVRVEDADGGIEEIPVSTRNIHEGSLTVSEIWRSPEGRVLIELPRESTSGRWRIWVKESSVVAA
jgi:hypothetical protein